MREILKIEFKHYHYWATIPLSYFMTIFCFIVKDYGKSLKYLKHYIKTSKIQKDPYYDEVIRLMNYLEKGKGIQFIEKNISSEILSDFDEVNIWNKIDLPQCPNCYICKLKELCNTQCKYVLEKKMLESKKKHVINQLEFEQICN